MTKSQRCALSSLLVTGPLLAVLTQKPLGWGVVVTLALVFIGSAMFQSNK
jgi:hypothetical protein